MFRSAGPLPQDAANKVKELGESAAYSSHLRHKDIALDAAERSCLTQLDKIRAKKEECRAARAKGTAAPPTLAGDGAKEVKGKEKPSSVPAGVPVVHLDDQDVTMPNHPGRKLRRGAELPSKALDRTEEGDDKESSCKLSRLLESCSYKAEGRL